MSASYIIDRSRSIVFSRAWGKVTDPEMVAHARALGADRRFHPDFRQIMDLRDAAELLVTASGIRQVVGMNEFAKTSRRAVVARTAVAFGMARMYQLAGDLDPSMRVCKTLEEALEWVGLEPTEPWPEGPVDASFQAG